MKNLNIREVAQLAGVSIATVSKVLNKKDQSISEETRQKVLAILKECHYQAYSGSRFPMRPHSFILGALLQNVPGVELFLERLLQVAAEKGYSVITRIANSLEEEQECAKILASYPLDGYIHCRFSDSTVEMQNELKDIPGCILRLSGKVTPETPGIDFEELGQLATNLLLQKKHRRILCVVNGESESENLFISGFQKSLTKNHHLSVSSQICRYGKNGLSTELLLRNTAALCFSTDLAEKVYKEAFQKNRPIPRNLSVLSLASTIPNGFLPKLSIILLPFAQLAEQACLRVISQIENTSSLISDWKQPVFEIKEGESLDFSPAERDRKIVVIGSINMDTTISLEHFPCVGQTSVARSQVLFPGGKGLNQAVAVAKLKSPVALIGKVGKDYAASQIWDLLQSYEIELNHLYRTSRESTGNAYICVREDGESGIMVYKGANALMTSQEIKDSESAFDGAEYCLVSTEIDSNVIKSAVELAWKKEVKIIMKPAAIDSIQDDLFDKIYLFIPNEKESSSLCPMAASVEEQADFFIKKGIKNVIITLGNRGCFWTNGVHKEMFSSADFESVDTTGAADAFIAALAVCLVRGFPMQEAIRRATIAAGFSTTQWGAASAMIDQRTFEFLCTTQKDENLSS